MSLYHSVGISRELDFYHFSQEILLLFATFYGERETVCRHSTVFMLLDCCVNVTSTQAFVIFYAIDRDCFYA